MPLFRRYARQLFSHRVGNAQPQRGNDRRHQDKAGERIEPAGKAAGVHARSSLLDTARKTAEAVAGFALMSAVISALWLRIPNPVRQELASVPAE